VQVQVKLFYRIVSYIMVLSSVERMSTIRLAVLTEYWSVTEGKTDRHRATAYTV